MKLLVVDDSRISRVMMINSIKKAIEQDLEILQAEDGLIGFELYKDCKPDLVLLDLTMPVMDGYEALEKIIEFDRDAKVYIITSDIQKMAQERVISMGAIGLVGKPISEVKIKEIFTEVGLLDG